MNPPATRDDTRQLIFAHFPLLVIPVQAVGEHGLLWTCTVCPACTVLIDHEVLAYVAWPCAVVRRLARDRPHPPPQT